MKSYLCVCTLLFTLGCSSSPETPAPKEILVKEKIQNNKTEAQKAQDAYLKLQKQRDKE